MAIRSEIQHRAEHLEHLMRAGLPRLWAVIVVSVAVVGGSVVLAVAWSVKHALWGLVAALAFVLVVIIEGSYRESRRVEKQHEIALNELRQTHKVELAARPARSLSPTYSPAAIIAAARMSGMSVPQGSAVSLRKLRDLIPEGEAMKARVAGRLGPMGLVQRGLPEEVADWESRVSAVLAPRPELLAQFQGAPPPRVFAVSGPAAELHDKLEARLKVLYAIVRGLEGRS